MKRKKKISFRLKCRLAHPISNYCIRNKWDCLPYINGLMERPDAVYKLWYNFFSLHLSPVFLFFFSFFLLFFSKRSQYGTLHWQLYIQSPAAAFTQTHVGRTWNKARGCNKEISAPEEVFTQGPKKKTAQKWVKLHEEFIFHDTFLNDSCSSLFFTSSFEVELVFFLVVVFIIFLWQTYQMDLNRMKRIFFDTFITKASMSSMGNRIHSVQFWFWFR